ncbi:hypothetical protein [Cysteiniphilum marinum]|uniref:hypothetical protein n=1 Tax=Cysteiniphilum marinum TaxID=2774191 RepID=UPI0019393608|nr:hypothetical protein [Cysteiniphilum marinum]
MYNFWSFGLNKVSTTSDSLFIQLIDNIPYLKEKLQEYTLKHKGTNDELLEATKEELRATTSALNKGHNLVLFLNLVSDAIKLYNDGCSKEQADRLLASSLKLLIHYSAYSNVAVMANMMNTVRHLKQQLNQGEYRQALQQFALAFTYNLVLPSLMAATPFASLPIKAAMLYKDLGVLMQNKGYFCDLFFSGRDPSASIASNHHLEPPEMHYDFSSQPSVHNKSHVCAL